MQGGKQSFTASDNAVARSAPRPRAQLLYHGPRRRALVWSVSCMWSNGSEIQSPKARVPKRLTYQTYVAVNIRLWLASANIKAVSDGRAAGLGTCCDDIQRAVGIRYGAGAVGMAAARLEPRAPPARTRGSRGRVCAALTVCSAPEEPCRRRERWHWTCRGALRRSRASSTRSRLPGGRGASSSLSGDEHRVRMSAGRRAGAAHAAARAGEAQQGDARAAGVQEGRDGQRGHHLPEAALSLVTSAGRLDELRGMLELG